MVFDGTCDGETPDPDDGVHATGEYRSRADLDAPVGSLASLNDGRVLAVEGGRAVRVVDANGAVEPPALVAESTKRFTEAMPDASSRRANAVLVGVIDTASNGTREFSIVRYREVENTLGEGATVIAGLVLSSDDEPRFTVDQNGWIYVAMPAAREGRADPYAGRILRFDGQGSVPDGVSPRSPVMADGFAMPSGLFSDGRRLWAAGRDVRWPGSLAMLNLDDADRREWPRTLGAFAIDPESGTERAVVALAGRRGADGQVVLGTVDDRGALSILRMGADGTRSTESRELGTRLRAAAIAFGPDDRVIVAAAPVVDAGGRRIAILESAAKPPRE